jgi:serine/threonine-protein kinase
MKYFNNLSKLIRMVNAIASYYSSASRSPPGFKSCQICSSIKVKISGSNRPSQSSIFMSLTINDRTKQIIIALLSGAGFGCLLLGGLWLFNQNQQQPFFAKITPNPQPSDPGISIDDMIKKLPSPSASPSTFPIENIPQPSPNAYQSPTVSPSSVVANPSNPSLPTNPSIATNSGTISREAGLDVLKRWLEYKRVLLAPPYNTQPASDILAGKAYIDNIDKSSLPCNSGDPDDCMSSVQWLRKYGGEYSFGLQKIDSLDRFEASGDRASMFVTITEYRTLRQAGKRNVSSGGTKKARYDLKYENGRVKITDYQVF